MLYQIIKLTLREEKENGKEGDFWADVFLKDHILSILKNVAEFILHWQEHAVKMELGELSSIMEEMFLSYFFHGRLCKFIF